MNVHNTKCHLNLPAGVECDCVGGPSHSFMRFWIENSFNLSNGCSQTVIEPSSPCIEFARWLIATQLATAQPLLHISIANM